MLIETTWNSSSSRNRYAHESPYLVEPNKNVAIIITPSKFFHHWGQEGQSEAYVNIGLQCHLLKHRGHNVNAADVMITYLQAELLKRRRVNNHRASMSEIAAIPDVQDAQGRAEAE